MRQSPSLGHPEIVPNVPGIPPCLENIGAVLDTWSVLIVGCCLLATVVVVVITITASAAAALLLLLLQLLTSSLLSYCVIISVIDVVVNYIPTLWIYPINKHRAYTL